MPTDNQHEIQKLIRIKLRCEKDPLFFIQYFFKKIDRKTFRLNWHHYTVRDYLMRVYNYDCTRLVINMPPRVGKTEFVINYFIAWCLMKNPSATFIHLSYNNRLAAKNSQKVKDIINSEEFQQLWGHIKVSKESKSKVEWEIEKYRGGMYAVSSEMGVTGYGAGTKDDGPHQKKFWGGIFIDDPVKVQKGEGTAEQINNYLQKVNDIFNSTIINRANNLDYTPIVINMQRVHENDLAGHVLSGKSTHEYEHLCFPVVNEKGESLWPYMFPDHVIENLRKMPSFNGQYMQNPQPDESKQTIKLKWFPRYDELPKKFEKVILSMDTAQEEKQINDPSVGMVFGLYNHRWYVIDVWRERVNFTKLKQRTANLINKYNPHVILIEKKSSGGMLIQELKTMGVPGVIPVNPTKDKVSRMEIHIEMVETGFIVLPERAPWLAALESEFSHFPNVTHDDQVDAFSQFLNRIKAKVKKLVVGGP